jgi:hypothetical protein
MTVFCNIRKETEAHPKMNMGIEETNPSKEEGGAGFPPTPRACTGRMKQTPSIHREYPEEYDELRS